MSVRDLLLGKPKPQTPAEIYSQPEPVKPVNPAHSVEAARRSAAMMVMAIARKKIKSEATKVAHPSFNARQDKFIELMCQVPVPTATQAARDAGYSPKTARVIGPRLLTNDA